MTSPREIRVTIGELVLDGFEPRERHTIAEAIRRDLARRLSDGAGGLDRWTGADRVDAGTVRLPAHAGPRRVGSLVGRSVHEAVSGGGPR